MNNKRDIGSDLPLTAEVIEAQTRQIETKTRRLLAICLFSTAMITLGAAALYSYFVEAPTAFLAIWSVLALPLGAMFTHYFGKTKPDDKGDDSGST
jgi:energy-converting hydrogenase Eha subunit A